MKQPTHVFGERLMPVPCNACVPSPCPSVLPIPGYVMKDAAAAVLGRGWAKTPGAGMGLKALGLG